MNTAVVTIISKNYLCYARTLMQSVTAAHPEWRQYVLMVDEISGDIDPSKEEFHLVEVARLPLPDRRRFYFRYSLLELNTAVKPWVLEWLFEHEGFDRVVYIDPDIYVFDRLTDVEEILDAGALMVLTPHLTGMLDDDGFPGELDILRTGSFNLGFIALSRHPSLGRFLKWWQGKLEFTCMVEPDKGFFYDQRWMDFAPGMFDDVVILRHDGYNVAHWNLYQRNITVQGGKYLVNGKPLVFWHFSSFSSRDPDGPEQLSKNHDRVQLTNREPIKSIARNYATRLAENGLETCSDMPYAFGFFSNGEPIPYWIRKAYREDETFQRAAGDDPFSTTIQFLNQPSSERDRADEPITNAMQYYWRVKLDLQASFPNFPHQREDRHRFIEWLVWCGARSSDFPKACLIPLQAYFRENPSLDEALKTPSGATESRGSYWIGVLLRGDDSRFLVDAYEAILKRYPDPTGFARFLADLRRGVSRIEILYAMRYSDEGNKIAAKLPGLRPLYIWRKIRRRGNRAKQFITKA